MENIDADYIIYTDGGCISNPGGIGGIGIVIIETDTGEIIEISKGFQSTTNNRMEIMAVIIALESVPEGSSVRLYSDSQYVVNTLNGQYREKKNLDLWERLHAMENGKTVSYYWVKGHYGDSLNERCDELAGLAITQEEMLTDEGYFVGKKYPKRVEYKNGAMGIKFQIPEKVKEYYEGEKFEISAELQMKIKKFNSKKHHSFKDYINLHSGRDAWSKVTASNGTNYFDQEIIYFVQTIIGDDRSHIISCLRWYGRGLSISNAIRKELVTMEVSDNAVKKSRKVK